MSIYCLHCSIQILKARTRQKFCSKACSGLSRRKDISEIRKTVAFRQSRYRAKQYKALHPEADPIVIKQIYANCPVGYEVDHIIPLSRGGPHHEDNLQYLLKEDNRRKGNRVVGDPGYDPSHHAVMSSRPSHLAHPPH
jgi:5-methylcytosine-specific restriction endonuclease McrA